MALLLQGVVVERLLHAPQRIIQAPLRFVRGGRGFQRALPHSLQLRALSGQPVLEGLRVVK